MQLLRITVAGLLLIANAQAQTHWQNSLKPEGKPATRLTVVEQGRAAVSICIPSHPTPSEAKAAQELQHWFKEITGATVEIKSGRAGQDVLLVEVLRRERLRRGHDGGETEG